MKHVYKFPKLKKRLLPRENQFQGYFNHQKKLKANIPEDMIIELPNKRNYRCGLNQTNST